MLLRYSLKKPIASAAGLAIHPLHSVAPRAGLKTMSVGPARALHYVLKIGDRKASVQFYQDVLKMMPLRHEEVRNTETPSHPVMAHSASTQKAPGQRPVAEP